MEFISKDMLNIVLGAAFIIFCIFMVFQINSDMNDTQRAIANGYGFANVVHSAQVFERTGVDLLEDIDYFEFENKHTVTKTEKQQKSAVRSKWEWDDC